LMLRCSKIVIAKSASQRVFFLYAPQSKHFPRTSYGSFRVRTDTSQTN
jgi:hypothetical protein